MEYVVLIHSWLRWVVLLLALFVIGKAIMGWLGKHPYKRLDNSLGASFIGSLHLQLVLGLVLYFLGAKGLALITENGMAAVMKDATLRFWAVEHITTMILAVVLAMVGRSRSRKAKTDWRKHQQAAIFYALALVLILARVPWGQVPLFKSMP